MDLVGLKFGSGRKDSGINFDQGKNSEDGGVGLCFFNGSKNLLLMLKSSKNLSSFERHPLDCLLVAFDSFVCLF